MGQDMNKDKIKSLFFLDVDITYLNCANMSPMLKSVRVAGLEAIETRAKPWKLQSADWFTNAEILREYAAQIYQTSADNIALVPSASYGLATAAKNLNVGKGKSIMVIEDQFPSNFYVWQKLSENSGLRIVTIRKEDNKSLTECILDKIDSSTGIIAIPNCHWIDGFFIDLKKISVAAKSAHAYLVLDLSQSLGAFPINIDEIDPDFAVSVGYKWLLGPYGLGYMYVSPKWHEKGEPLEYSWLTRDKSDDFTSLINYTNDYRTGARKFDMGEFSQFNNIPMAIAALKQILEWKVEFIQSSIRILTDMLFEYSRSRKTNGENFTKKNIGHIIAIPLETKNIEVVKDKISENRIVVSYRGSAIRVSPHIYNNKSDIDKLIQCL